MPGIDSYTKFISHFNGNDGAKEIVDSGATGHVVTCQPVPPGTPCNLSIGVTPKFGSSSLLLNGTDQYVTMPDHADWDFAGNWTVEGFIYMTADQRCPIFSHRTDNNNMIYGEVLETSHEIRIIIFNGGALQDDVVSAAGAVSLNTLTHVAFARIGSSYYIFVNGVQVATAAVSKTWTGFTGTLQIGHESDHTATEKFFAGYIDEVRVSNLDRSTGAGASFPVPTTAYTSDANTLLLLHMDSLDVSSTTAPKIPTFVGTAQLDLNPKMGSGCGKFNGSSSYLTVPDSNDWDFGTGAFEINLWARFTSVASGTYNFVSNQSGSTGFGFRLDLDGGKLDWFYNTTATKIQQAWVPLANTWYNIKLVYDGAKIYFYIDSVLLNAGGTVYANNPDASAGALYIGADPAPSNYFNGYMDEISITKGTSNVLLLHLDGNVTDSATGKTVTNTAVTLSKFYGSLLLDGNSDYVTVPDSADWDWGTGEFEIDCWVRVVDATPTSFIFGRGGTISHGIYIESEKVVVYGLSTTIVGTISVLDNTWTHIAVTGDGSKIRLFVGGVKDGEQNQNITTPTGSKTLILGTNPTSLNSNDFNGYIDELRISKGIARWTADFKVPTEEYSADTTFTDSAAHALALTLQTSVPKLSMSPSARTLTLALQAPTTESTAIVINPSTFTLALTLETQTEPVSDTVWPDTLILNLHGNFAPSSVSTQPYADIVDGAGCPFCNTSDVPLGDI